MGAAPHLRKEGFVARFRALARPRYGEVAEWLKAPHSKCGILARVSGVRIPPSPPDRRPSLIADDRRSPDNLIIYSVLDAHGVRGRPPVAVEKCANPAPLLYRNSNGGWHRLVKRAWELAP